MPIKIIEVLTRPNKDVPWKNPDRLDDWDFTRSSQQSSVIGLIEEGPVEISDNDCKFTEYSIFENLESFIRTNAWHKDLTKLRRDQQMYRSRVNITQDFTLIDVNTGEVIPKIEYDAKVAELRASGFDPCVP